MPTNYYYNPSSGSSWILDTSTSTAWSSYHFTPAPMPPNMLNRFPWSRSPYGYYAPGDLSAVSLAMSKADTIAARVGIQHRYMVAIEQPYGSAARALILTKANSWLEVYEREGIRDYDGISYVMMATLIEGEGQLSAAEKQSLMARLMLVLCAQLFDATYNAKLKKIEPGEREKLKAIAENLAQFMTALKQRVDGRIRKEVNVGKYHSVEEATSAFFGNTGQSLRTVDVQLQAVQAVAKSLNKAEEMDAGVSMAQSLTT